MAADRSYYVYIMANRRFTTLYIGVTNDLERRVWEHKNRVNPASFTARFNLCNLAYFEDCPSIADAIAWEKRLKGWRRARKDALIGVRNPQHHDLAADWYD